MARTGRPRGFDEQDVVERAREVFWTRGYQATSVQDLIDALGIQRGSLYATFGDKHHLYLRAVDLYARENRARLEAVLSEGPVIPALRRMLTQPAVLTGAAASAPRRGCLVGNTTAQLQADDAAARELVAAAFEGFLEVVTAALRRGQAGGEISTGAPPEVQARLLLTLFQGAALLSRADDRPGQSTASIDLALQVIAASDQPAR